MGKIVSLCKRRGFVFPGSEIYGGLAGTYDYGPYGVELRNNIKQYFWDKFVNERDNVYGMGAAIFMHPKVWEASGHVENFADTMVECKTCHERFKADDEAAISDHEKNHQNRKEKVVWTEPKQFKSLVSSSLGATEDDKTEIYLRGEITQGVHVNFKNIIDSIHPKIPFGIAQIGKAFRNEIKPANFLYRLREFEQMELQYYVHPDDAEAQKQFAFWKRS